MHWSDKYLGTPWRDGGRHDDDSGVGAGLDCWGLLRAVYAAERGVSLPSWSGIEAVDGAAVSQAMLDGIGDWAATRTPVAFDGVLLRKGRAACHVGVMVDAGRFLHVDEDLPACVEALFAPIWKRRVVGIYRYAPSPQRGEGWGEGEPPHTDLLPAGEKEEEKDADARRADPV